MELGSLAPRAGAGAGQRLLRRHRVRAGEGAPDAARDAGRAGAGRARRMALTMRKNLDIWLSASQVGITLASLAPGLGGRAGLRAA